MDTFQQFFKFDKLKTNQLSYQEENCASPQVWLSFGMIPRRIHLSRWSYASLNSIGRLRRLSVLGGDGFCVPETDRFWCEMYGSTSERKQKTLWRWRRTLVKERHYPHWKETMGWNGAAWERSLYCKSNIKIYFSSLFSFPCKLVLGSFDVCDLSFLLIVCVFFVLPLHFLLFLLFSLRCLYFKFHLSFLI